jgi:hypothetical protein
MTNMGFGCETMPYPGSRSCVATMEFNGHKATWTLSAGGPKLQGWQLYGLFDVKPTPTHTISDDISIAFVCTNSQSISWWTIYFEVSLEIVHTTSEQAARVVMDSDVFILINTNHDFSSGYCQGS